MCIPCVNEKSPVQCSISLHYPQTVQTFSEIHRNHQKIIEFVKYLKIKIDRYVYREPMIRYTYHVSVGNQHATCQDVNTVIVFVNSMIGCDLLSRNMVYNYFSRPHLANKRLFGTRALVQISRDVNDRDATIQPQCEVSA